MQGRQASGLGSARWSLACRAHDVPTLEHPMILILSCITKGEQQLRRTLDRLTHSGIGTSGIVVLHPGEALGAPSHPPMTGSSGPMAAESHASQGPSPGDQLATAGAAAS